MAAELKQHSIDLWNTILDHRFILELGTDFLPLQKFVFYLKQDQIFLVEFCRFLLAAKRKSEANSRLKEWFELVYDGTLNFEMRMQKELLTSLGIPGTQDTKAAANTTTSNYISYLKKVSSIGTINQVLCAMAPCPWSYLEIACKLARCNNTIKTDVYHRWVQFYASAESHQQVSELRLFLDDLYSNANQQEKSFMKSRFETACKYELDFWEMCYNQGQTGSKYAKQSNLPSNHNTDFTSE